MELFSASNQWATRPDDERFWTVKEAFDACEKYRATASEAIVKQGDLRVEPTAKGLALVGKQGKAATLTHWAFDQLAEEFWSPAGYLRSLSPELAAANLNYCIKDDDQPAREHKLLLHANGDTIARCISSTKYGRIWNADVFKRALDLPKGWRTPPARPARERQAGTRPATKADVLDAKNSAGLSIKVGDLIAPAAIYASDHDMFLFEIDESKRIKDGSPEGLCRGFFIENSEVANDESFKLTTFLYKSVCGNHICWGAQNVTELRVRHIGKNPGEKAFSELQAEVVRYADEGASETEAQIKSARKLKLGDDKEAVLDAIFKIGIAGVGKSFASDAYDIAEKHRELYGDPRTLWGVVNGMTHLSQDTPFGDERVMRDRAAGKLLRVALAA